MNILDYIKGTKKGKEAKDFEEKIMRDPFLAEAMEGYEHVKGNHDLIISRLRQQVFQKTKKKKFRQPMFIWSSIVSAVAVIAIVVIFFLGGFHHYFHDQKQVTTVADSADLIANPVVADSVESTTEVASTVDKPGLSRAEDATNVSGKKLIAKASPIIPSGRDNQSSKSPTKGKGFSLAERKQATDTTNYVVNYNPALLKQPDSEMVDISGVVKDEKSSPITGVKVNAGSLQEVYSGSDGKFNLKNVLKGQKITFSYIGFKTEVIVVEDKTTPTMAVTMSEDNDYLAEQVIISKDQWKKAKREGQKANPLSGFSTYQKYIDSHKKCISDGDCKGKTGKIKVAFSTDKNGRPYNIRVAKGLCPEYDRQAISLINNGEAWTANCKSVEYEMRF